MRAYYFGCNTQAGYYMYRPDMTIDWDFFDTNPWGHGIDGELLKGHKERYVLTQKDGWTALSLIDNTVDSRPGSNSSFLAEGSFTLDQMFEIAHRNFPRFTKRTSLPVPAPASTDEEKGNQ